MMMLAAAVETKRMGLAGMRNGTLKEQMRRKQLRGVRHERAYPHPHQQWLRLHRGLLLGWQWWWRCQTIRLPEIQLSWWGLGLRQLGGWSRHQLLHCKAPCS
jgi:hypothetical protein